MPTYTFGCQVCDYTEERFGSISELGEMKKYSYCCNIPMLTKIQPSRDFFFRTVFGKNTVFEHADEVPRTFRDKYHLQDHCEEVGIRSRLLEDGDVR